VKTEPGRAAATVRRRRPATIDPALARRWMWIGLAVVFVVLPFFSATGRYVPDSRDATWFAPGTDISQQFLLWKSSPTLGIEQHAGILIPMGAVVGILRGIGLPVWVAERLWHGLLLFVAAAGMVLLIDFLRSRRTVAAPAIAAVVYTLTPYAFGYGLPTTAAFVPYVLLPLLMYVTARGLGRDGLAGPALVGLTSFLMGGGNGAPQVYVFVPVIGYMAWAAWVDRSVTTGRVLKFAAWSFLFVVAMNAYWVFTVSSTTDVANVLAFSEQPSIINVTSSLSETIRGLGFWGFYGGNAFGSWVPTVRSFITSPILILAGFALPIAAIATAWLSRWRYRLFFLFLMILAVMVMSGIFPVRSPTPFGHLLLRFFQDVPGGGGLRTTYKFGPALALAVAALVGVGVEEAGAWAASLDWAPAARLGIAGLVVLVLGANSYPLWTGSLYAANKGTSDIPGYWTNALRAVDKDIDGYRAFFAPGSAGAVYRWGTLHDGIAEATPWLPSVHQSRVPVGQRYGSNLLAAIEQRYQGGLEATDAAALFRYLGVKDVILQNDLDWKRDATARPAELQVLTKDPSLGPAQSYGRPGENVTAAPAPGQQLDATTKAERQLPPVQVLPVPDPVPVVRVSGAQPVVVSGDGFGLVAAAGQRLLDGTPPVVYSGSITPEQLSTLAQDRARFVVTDTNRRRAWSYSALRHNFSYTLPEDQTLPGSIAYGLFDGRTSTQTVAIYEGVRSITASGYGSAFGQLPKYRPAAAFDGDLKTSWQVGFLADPVGQWIQASFDGPVTLSKVSLTVPPTAAFGFARQITSARLEFSDGTSVQTAVRPGANEVKFPQRTSSFLRIRIASVNDSTISNGVGFSEIAIPGVHVQEILRVPTDLFDAAGELDGGLRDVARAPLTYLFDRARTTVPLEQDEEQTLARRFRVPGNLTFDIHGTARVRPDVAEDVLDTLLHGPTDVSATSSSRYLGAFPLRASSAIDGENGTAWIPQGNTGEWLKLTFPSRKLGQMTIRTATGLGRGRIDALRLTFSDGSFIVAKVPFTGLLDLSFPARTVSAVQITITSVPPPAPGTKQQVVGIAEVGINGVQLPPVDPSSPLSCFTDSGLAIDRRQVAIRMDGTAGDLLAGKTLPFAACGGEPIALIQGVHDLVAGNPIQPNLVELDSAGSGAPAETPGTPSSMVVGHDGSYRVTVKDATGPVYLTIGQNDSSKWFAAVDGQSLGTPLLLDGYSAGWRMDRKGTYTVSVRYLPQRRYDLALLLSVLAVLAALAILAVDHRRKRRVP
jgi:arabinofuranan 3-O-arabinosyltransferase